MKELNFLWGVMLLLFMACENTEIENSEPQKGRLEIGIVEQVAGDANGRIFNEETEPHYVLITIESKSGIKVFDRKKIPVLAFGSTYVSETIELDEGEYKLVEFFVQNGDDEIVYAAPQVGSPKADYVENPLPIQFEVVKASITPVQLEVVFLAEGDTPDAFGYASFSFTIVNSTYAVYEVPIALLGIQDGELRKTAAKVSIQGFDIGGVERWTEEVDLSEDHETISLKPGYAEYWITPMKDGFQAKTKELKAPDLKKDPSMLWVLIKEDESAVVLNLQYDLFDYDSATVTVVNEKEYYQAKFEFACNEDSRWYSNVRCAKIPLIDGTYDQIVTIYKESTVDDYPYWGTQPHPQINSEIIQCENSIGVYGSPIVSEVYGPGGSNAWDALPDHFVWEERYQMAIEEPSVYVTVGNNACDMYTNITLKPGSAYSCLDVYVDRMIWDAVNDDNYVNPQIEYRHCNLRSNVEFSLAEDLEDYLEYLDVCNSTDFSDKRADTYVAFREEGVEDVSFWLYLEYPTLNKPEKAATASAKKKIRANRLGW